MWKRVAFWLTQVIALVAVISWATLDPAFELMAYRLRSSGGSPWLAFSDAAGYVGYFRVSLIIGILAICIGSLLVRLACVLKLKSRTDLEPKRHLSLRTMLGVVTLIAAWCGLAVNYSAVSMRAKGIRVAWELNELEALAAPLRKQWPDYDGDLPNLGPFMAYPFGRPSTLILLNPRSIAEGKLTVSTVERDGSGAIRLLLGSETSGTDYGDWVEWHPAGSLPSSFVGGLDDFHALRTSVALGNGWYLVRYGA